VLDLERQLFALNTVGTSFAPLAGKHLPGFISKNCR
jgi:hypothetical protein